jgi:hypothetical protein
MKRSQSEMLRRTFSAPSTSPCTTTENTRPPGGEGNPILRVLLLGKLGVLTLGSRRIGVAAVGADQSVHHELER